MDKKYFEEIIKERIKEMPAEHREAIDNVNFFVEDYPTPEQIRKIRLKPNHTLFGLYEGVPLTKRGLNYQAVLPDKITIFRMPILSIYRTEPEVRKQIRKTTWHEIAHYFGMNEEEVRRAEKKRSE